MELYIQFLTLLVLLGLGFSIGTLVERAHLRRLAAREEAVSDMLVTDVRSLPVGLSGVCCGLVTGEVVIASDYFKSFAANLRKLIGGELHTFESLMVRARREATLRVLESAREMGADAVINMRFSTSNIGAMRRKGGAAMVEMYACGTAIRLTQARSG
jgi:uncharacterized protein YbjQ (UPF0145 family)